MGGPSRRSSMSIINGERSSSTVLAYRVIAEQPGLALVPSVSIDHDGGSLTTEALRVFVTEDPDYMPLDEMKTEPEPARRRKRPTVKL